ncbi:MAG TPA: hypothetical protein VHX39_08790 [Acetobacteraceae bacterium]|jgi:hypothetical protein|nr:hypothetical protein [Acetobacteraceae bacterium]
MPDFIFETACETIAATVGVRKFRSFDGDTRWALLWKEMRRLNAKFADSTPPELPDEWHRSNPLFE